MTDGGGSADGSVDPHRMGDFEIGAVHLWADGGHLVQPIATVFQEGRTWSDLAVVVEWGWLPEGVEAEDFDGPMTWSPVMPVMPIPEGGGALLGRATRQDGRVAWHIESVPEDFPSGLSGHVVGYGTETGQLDPGGSITLDNFSDADQDTWWVSNAGSWSGLDGQSATWTANAYTPSGAAAAPAPLGPGVYTVGAGRHLHLEGGDMALADVLVGDQGDGAWVDNRWLPGALVGWQQLTLVADDQSSTGLRAQDATAVDVLAVPERDGTLMCGDANRFEPDWLSEGTCTRAEMIGAMVWLEGSAVP